MPPRQQDAPRSRVKAAWTWARTQWQIVFAIGIPCVWTFVFITAEILAHGSVGAGLAAVLPHVWKFAGGGIIVGVGVWVALRIATAILKGE